jgi:hypothetical protein
MPKELTHWWLAAQAHRQLSNDSPVRHLLEHEQAAYLVGAVLPDSLLHLIRGHWSATALRLAHNFHEPSGNSFAPLVWFVEGQGQEADSKSFPCPLPLAPAVTACLLGVAAHIEADIVFHPYICALSGNDIGLHYRYETELDLWLLQGGKKPPVWRLQALLTSQVREVAVTVAQGIFDQGGELPRSTVMQALQLHSSIQCLYGSPVWQLLARWLALLPLPALRSRQKLFYPFDWQRGRSLPWPDRWLHPATGQLRYDSPEDLAAAALDRITRLLCCVDQEGLLVTFQKQPGENLITGIKTGG